MKFVIKKSSLEKLVNIGLQAIPVKTADITYLNFVMSLTDKGLGITASDGTIALHTEISTDEGDINNIEQGSTCLLASAFAQAVSKLSGEMVDIATDGNQLVINDGKAKLRFNTKGVENYPDINFDIEDENLCVKIDSKDYRAAFNAVKGSVATSGSRDMFYGVYLQADNGILQFTATDSYRVAIYRINLSDVQPFAYIVPLQAMNIISGADSTISIYSKNGTGIVFKTDSTVVVTRLIGGVYPSLDRFTSNEYNEALKFSKEEFLNALDIVGLVASNNSKECPIRLSFDGKACTLYADNLALGDAKVSLDFNTSFEEPFEISFSAPFVINALKTLNDEDFEFMFNETLAPFRIKGSYEFNYQIITPLRTLA